MVKSSSVCPSSPAQKDWENARALWSSLKAWWKDPIYNSLWRRALKEHKVDPAKFFQEYLSGGNVPPGHSCKVLFVKGSRCSYFSMMTCLPWGLGVWKEMLLASKSPMSMSEWHPDSASVLHFARCVSQGWEVLQCFQPQSKSCMSRLLCSLFRRPCCVA